ncbi:MAG: hypothetical protein KKE23_03745 [Nanoarchaeota archaeon]|nr:hypothetical protein [Nanoarchaeota archaeon]
MEEKPLAEITLRKYETPYKLGKRELAKKICLSLGLLQTSDNRDVIVDILLVLIEAQKKKEQLDIGDIKKRVIESRKAASCEEKGIAESNLRRQLRRLKDLMLAEKFENKYRIAEHSSLSRLFDEKIVNFLVPSITARIKEYLEELEKSE